MINIRYLFVAFHSIVLSLTTCASDQGSWIDATLDRHYQTTGQQTLGVCSETDYVRRVTLDLAGRVPTIDELDQFIADPDRKELVDRLLASGEFDRYWAQVWTTILVGRSPERQTDRESLRRWIESSFQMRRPLDQITFDLISAQGTTSLDGPVNFLVGNQEDPITAVSRVFLGVQLDCARCHDHPYDRWSQDDYQAMRRFFTPVNTREVSGGIRVDDNAMVTEDDNDLPRFLTGARPRTAAWRREMALMTVRSKPFARAMGNRIWQQLFGRGLVNPVDGLSDSDVPTVPELHDELGIRLRQNGFDARRLIREICLSDAYRRESSLNLDDPRQRSRAESVFAARKARPMLPEQIVLSYATVLQQRVPRAESWNDLAIDVLGRSAAKAGCTDPFDQNQTSQGLLLELASSGTFPMRRVDDVFRATLCRLPTGEEREWLQSVSVQDVQYALLHCNEFMFCR